MKMINNILKLEGYGVYVTVHKDKMYHSNICPKTNRPTLDPDGCIEWTETKEVPNQAFLNLANAAFGTSFTKFDFGAYPSVSEIKNMCRGPVALLPAPSGMESIDVNKLIWDQKNRKEMEK